MARYTIREFTEVVGLGKDMDSMMRSGIILKMLCGLGLAREAGKKQGGTGRPAVVYDVQEPIVIPVGLGRQVLASRAAPQDPVAVQAPQESVAVQAPAQTGFYDDDDED